MFRTLTLTVVFACNTIAAQAHEFWILGNPTQIGVDEQVVASLHVGQSFKGGEMAFLPPNFRLFAYGFGGKLANVPGRIGDRPAVTMPAPGEGLLVLLHVTAGSSITWDTWEEFESFVVHKDSPEMLEAHKARGLPDANFTEVYSRYVKGLIGIGDATGEDREWGLLTEIVALENPYTDDMSDGIDVALFYQGEPRRNAQIEVFDKAADETVVISTVRTDDEGHATVPVIPGHTYMLDAVVLRETSAEVAAATNAVWESLWANITFGIPES